MAFLVGSSCVLVILLTLIACSDTIRKEGVKRQQLRNLTGKSRFLDEELELNFWDRFLLPIWKRILQHSMKLIKGNQRGSAKKNNSNQRLENELRMAGIHLEASEFLLIRILVTIGILFFGVIGVMLLKAQVIIQFLIILFALMISLLIPRYFVKARIKSRRTAIQNQMPSIMDVLSVSIEAGLGFDAALQKVIERFKGPLIDELTQVYREVGRGIPRREALASLGQRSNVPELQTFASVVAQSEQFGTPMKNVLRGQAHQLRVSRRQLAQEKGMKAPVRMMLPMVIFIFPVIFIILLGPTLINVIAQFS